MKRVILIGDVHGCIDELDALLALLRPRRGVDEVVFLGDLVDRGPDPVAVVRRARELGARCALGNHEEKHLRFRKHEARRELDPGYRNPMKPFAQTRAQEHARLSDDDWAFLDAMPLYVSLPEHSLLAVHAGFEPGRSLQAQKRAAVIRVREVDARGRFVSSGNPLLPVPGAVPWAERWRGPQSVAYGHHVHSLDAPRIDTPAPGVTCWGLDTGACFGGHLSALVLPEREIVQVRAQRAYADLGVLDEA